MLHIHNRAALRRCLVAGAAALAGSGLIGAAAQVITDPTNSVEVSTAGEASSAYLVAVSSGGNGSASSTGVAVAVGSGQASSQTVAASTGGTASSCGGHVTLAFSLQGAGSCPGSPVEDPSGLALWGVGDGCASGAYVAAGLICAGSSNGVAVADSGDAGGRVSATSVGGNASAGELAVAGGGSAYACGGPNPVAFSPTGPSSSCRGTLPVGAQEGGLSFNGG